MEDLIGIALRLAFMYLYALALVRLSGKRSIGSLTALDFIATLILGDLFDDVIWSEVPLASGITGLGAIMLAHTFFAYLGYRFPAFDHWVIGSYPVNVVKSGRWQPEGMRKERLTKEQGWSHLHKLGEDQLEEIREANVEPSGSFGLIKKDPAKTVQKKDLGVLKKRIR